MKINRVENTFACDPHHGHFLSDHVGFLESQLVESLRIHVQCGVPRKAGPVVVHSPGQAADAQVGTRQVKVVLQNEMNEMWFQATFVHI